MKENLTNEHLRKRFSSLFELVNYAIGLTVERMQEEHPEYLYDDVYNLPYEILLEIADGKEELARERSKKNAVEAVAREAAKEAAESNSPRKSYL